MVLKYIRMEGSGTQICSGGGEWYSNMLGWRGVVPKYIRMEGEWYSNMLGWREWYSNMLGWWGVVLKYVRMEGSGTQIY